VIVPLHAGNPGPLTGPGNWTYLIPGHNPVLIDAGVGDAIHLDALAAARADGPGRVLVTHGHSDHASGVVAVHARWPQTVFAKLPWPSRDDRYRVKWEPLVDGQVVAAGDESLQVVHTPGHSPDHVAFWHEPSRTLFSGDLVVAGTTVVIPATAGGNLTDYLHSLRRVLALEPARLLPAHGPAIDDPPAILRRYIEHRRQRETDVLTALEHGLTTVDTIADRVYHGLAEALVPMARESVLAHLIKLEADGLARRAGDGWTTEN
jgi:glyoxylase-like metal-dependent hydrolase (beta-lactamase superfamily II)